MKIYEYSCEQNIEYSTKGRVS